MPVSVLNLSIICYYFVVVVFVCSSEPLTVFTQACSGSWLSVTLALACVCVSGCTAAFSMLTVPASSGAGDFKPYLD